MSANCSQPTIIDLFSGVGGISLGAARAGFSVTGAVDFNPRAMAAHARNFPNTRHISGDLLDYTGSKLLSELNIKRPHGIVGGPPCQGFSTMGHRNLDDSRNNLFKHFFKLVNEIRPKFFIAENVTGILDRCYRSLVDEALSLVEDNYTIIRGLEVCAADFGAPTLRRRALFIGTLNGECDALPSEVFSPAITERVYVGQALAGLPKLIRSDWQNETQGWRKVEGYSKDGFHKRLSGHIPEGVGCPIAITRLKKAREVSGCLGTTHTIEVKKRFARLKPGKADSISKCVRLDANGFCPTLRAGTGPELGSYQAVRPVHPSSPRVITPREAARLQGFPDWFTFDSTKWHSFRMIGNSVSPILAEKMLFPIFKKLTS